METIILYILKFCIYKMLECIFFRHILCLFDASKTVYIRKRNKTLKLTEFRKLKIM